MQTIEDIMNNWEADCVIDDTHLDKSAIDTAKLHSKYLNVLIKSKMKLTKIKNEYKILRGNKFRYYRGELSKAELDILGWKQYEGVKPVRAELDDILETDVDISKMTMKIEYMNSVIEALESIMGQIKGRDWAIRNAITWKQFINGN